MSRTNRVFATGTTAALLLLGGLVSAPAASADSRCNTNDHTHGTAWWTRTDHYITGWCTGSPAKIFYWHTNSDPKGC